jgi:hypothetical protein
MVFWRLPSLASQLPQVMCVIRDCVGAGLPAMAILNTPMQQAGLVVLWRLPSLASQLPQGMYVVRDCVGAGLLAMAILNTPMQQAGLVVF